MGRSLSRFRLICRTVLAGLLASIVMIVVGVMASPAHAATAVRIMPLGDSITGSPGCWRALLWNRLRNTGYTNIDFVGTLPPQGCGIAYDGENEGHGGGAGHQRRRPEPASRLALGDPARRRADALRHQ